MTESGFSQSNEMDRQSLPPQQAGLRVWPWVLLAVALIGVVAWRATRNPAGSDREGTAHPAVGTKLVTFRLEPLTGGGRAVAEADLAGKVSLVNFWGPWCGPCGIEFPHLMEVERHFRGSPDFQFFSISSNANPFDDTGLAESTEHFLKQHQADFPTYRDPQAETTRALIQAAKLENFGYPTTVLLDRQATIRGIWMGFMPGDERQIERAVERALQGQSPPAG
jgi:thiol-disulfide isomerase/thioredoxin